MIISAMNSPMSHITHIKFPRSRSSRYGGTVPAASRAMIPQGSWQLNVASTINSDSSAQPNENRAPWLGSVAHVASRNNKASNGSSGASS